MISIIVPCYNEADNIPPLFSALKAELGAMGEPYEVLFVDDGSQDATLERISRMADGESIRYLSLSRNFGHQIALKAGLDYAIGDAVITMDADLQHPPSLLPLLVRKWREGFMIVNTVRLETEEEGLLKKATSKLFYRLFEAVSGMPLSPGSADFRLLDMRVVEELRRFKEPHLFLRGLVQWVGFKNTSVEYSAPKRSHGASKYSLMKMVQLGRDGVMAFSIRPLRVAGLLGLCTSFFAAMYILYGIYAVLFTDRTIPGWASILVSVLFLGGIQMVFLGLLGEYIGKIFIESKQRPQYLIKEASAPQKL